mmetsp:Transcript_28832/g.39634  ORF Transcript_28832/g.39634 Transcript_28832/m.39634 type:complete len:212 (-) Transcript_28832:434-1069(-)
MTRRLTQCPLHIADQMHYSSSSCPQHPGNVRNSFPPSPSLTPLTHTIAIAINTFSSIDLAQIGITAHTGGAVSVAAFAQLYHLLTMEATYIGLNQYGTSTWVTCEHDFNVCRTPLHAQRSQHFYSIFRYCANLFVMKPLAFTTRAIPEAIQLGTEVHERSSIHCSLIIPPNSHHFVLSVPADGVHSVFHTTNPLLHQHRIAYCTIGISWSA